jgi:hypothetical protein
MYYFLQKNDVVGDPKFAIIDADDTDQYVVTISGGLHAGLFSMDGGTGSVTFASDYDVDSSLYPSVVTLDIRATDGGGLGDTTRLQITITNVNQPPHVMNLPQQVTFPEDTEPGSALYTILVEDPDTDDPMNYFTTFEPSSGSPAFLFDAISKLSRNFLILGPRCQIGKAGLVVLAK